MTGREKQEAEDHRLTLFRAVHWVCPVCNKPLNWQGTPQLGHRVPKKKQMLIIWGPEAIHSPLNMVPVCGLDCNAKVSIGTISLEAKALLTRIVRINTGRETMPNLETFYAELRDGFQSSRNA